MHFNFHGFAIFAFFVVLILRLLGTVVLKYLWVKYLRIYIVSSYTIYHYTAHNSIRQLSAGVQNLLDLIFSGIPGLLGFLGLCDGLVILAHFHRLHSHRSASHYHNFLSSSYFTVSLSLPACKRGMVVMDKTCLL